MVTTIIIVVVVLVIIFAIAGSDDTKKQTRKTSSNTNKKPPKFNDNMSVSQMVSVIETVKDLRTLERKSESLAEKHFNTNDYKYDSLSKKYYEAFEKGSKIVFKYQFIPKDEINTPIEILEQSYKIVDSKSDLIQGVQDLNKYGKWEEFDGDILLQNSVRDVAEPKPDYWNGVVKFRKIVESNDPKETKIDLITKLAKSNIDFRENSISDDLDDLNDFIKEYLK